MNYLGYRSDELCRKCCVKILSGDMQGMFSVLNGEYEAALA